MMPKEKWMRQSYSKRFRNRESTDYKDGFFDAIDVIRREIATRSAIVADELYRLNLHQEMEIVRNVTNEMMSLGDIPKKNHLTLVK